MAQLQNDFDTEKIFVGHDKKFKEFTLLNGSGAEKDFARGLIMGQVHASGRVVPLVSTATDGSQIPIGILATEVDDLADSGTATVMVFVGGEVVQEKLIFDNGTDTLDTVISDRRLGTRLMADTMGILTIETNDLSAHDNS